MEAFVSTSSTASEGVADDTIHAMETAAHRMRVFFITSYILSLRRAGFSGFGGVEQHAVH
jgi:hypothetical protein